MDVTDGVLSLFFYVWMSSYSVITVVRKSTEKGKEKRERTRRATTVFNCCCWWSTSNQLFDVITRAQMLIVCRSMYACCLSVWLSVIVFCASVSFFPHVCVLFSVDTAQNNKKCQRVVSSVRRGQNRTRVSFCSCPPSPVERYFRPV